MAATASAADLPPDLKPGLNLRQGAVTKDNCKLPVRLLKQPDGGGLDLIIGNVSPQDLGDRLMVRLFRIF